MPKHKWTRKKAKKIPLKEMRNWRDPVKKKNAGCSARFSNLGMWGWGVYRVAKQHAVAYFIASNPEPFKSKYLTALRWGKHLSKPALKNTGKL